MWTKSTIGPPGRGSRCTECHRLPASTEFLVKGEVTIKLGTRGMANDIAQNGTQKILSNVPQDITCSAPRRRKIHDNSMYFFASRCTNKIIHATSMYFFEIASKSMHTEELAAGRRHHLFCVHVFWCDFKKIHAISMQNFICAATCEVIHAIIIYFSSLWGGTFNGLGNIR